MRALALILLLLPVPLYAAALDLLEEGIGDVEHVLTQDREDAADEERTDALERSSELFPMLPGEDDDRTGEGTAPYVTFTGEGITIVLRDVPSDAWFAPFVRYVAIRGIVSGYRDDSGRPTGEYGPANAVTVEELAKMAVEAASIDEALCGADPRNARAAGRWSRLYVACAEERGWAVWSDGSVDLLRPATRAEVVVTVLQAFVVGIPRRMGTGSTFIDVTPSTQFRAAIEKAASDGIISGHADDAGLPAGEFQPTHPVNRAEVAKIFSLALQLYAK